MDGGVSDMLPSVGVPDILPAILPAIPPVAASYLIGSIPMSWLVCRAVRGADLRTLGSGNLGATNLYRVMGLRVAAPVALFDMAKGLAPVLWAGPEREGLSARWTPTGCSVTCMQRPSGRRAGLL